MMPEYLTVSEVSQYLKLPEETVYKYARTGRIPASKVGRYWRFERSRVDEWVNRHSNQVQAALKVLVVDDDPSVRSLLTRWLKEAGADAEALSGGDELLRLLADTDADAIFLDLMMPSPNGVETLARIRSVRPDIDVVIVTAFFDGRLMDEALEHGPLTLLKKPVDKDALLALLAGMSAKVHA